MARSRKDHLPKAVWVYPTPWKPQRKGTSWAEVYDKLLWHKKRSHWWRPYTWMAKKWWYLITFYKSWKNWDY